MIEKYFRAGIRYLWNKPDNVDGPQNGAIVRSVSAANDLSYHGLDSHREVVDPFFLRPQPNKVLGLRMKENIQHTWLDYAPGRTAWVQIGGNDILTGFMSGCLIVRGTYDGQMSAFHVGTVEANTEVNQAAKRNFAQNLPEDATGFSPADVWGFEEISSIMKKLDSSTPPGILALVTTAGEFHSILMFNVSENGKLANDEERKYWCVGGGKQVTPLNHDELRTKLLS